MSFLSQFTADIDRIRCSNRPEALYIAPEGQILVPGTPAFYDRIGYRNPDFDVGDYAVRNMGFLSFGRLSADRIRLRFRPSLASGKTIEAACRYLTERPVREVELEYLDDQWRSELWPNDPALLHRLVELCAKPAKHTDLPPFHVEPLELRSAAEDYSHPLKPMFQKWRASLGQFNETTLPFLQRFGFFPKLVIISAARPGEPLRFQFLGSGIQIYDEGTICRLIGEPVTDQPDKAYGQWANAQYTAFLESNQPRLDCIEAKIRYSSDQIRSTRYERLLLPWRGRNGATILTVASVVHTDERLKVANENVAPPNPDSSGGANATDDGAGVHEVLDAG